MRVPTGGRSCDRRSCLHSCQSYRNVRSLPLVDAVTSGALAPLPSLVELANELLMLRAIGILLRGRSAAAQTETFSVASQFQFKSFRNNFDPDARIDCGHSRAQAQK
jgi:16S rRNA G527 N7-methylase RsmG